MPRARADVVFDRADERLGRFALRPVSPDGDAVLLHGRLTHPKSAFWQMPDADVARAADTYRRIAGSEHHGALAGLHDGEPAFLVECYDPVHDAVGRAYPVVPGDAGMHFLVSPTDDPLHGFTRAVLVTITGLAPADWLRAYLDAYLRPVLHCSYRYGLVFVPHGENVILAIDGGVPRRAFFKDIGEEIAVLDPDVPLPPGVERVRAEVPDEPRTLSVFTDVCDCSFRFLAPLLDRAGLLSEVDFWAAVAGRVLDYQASVPELADRSDPAGSLRLAGTLASFARVSR